MEASNIAFFNANGEHSLSFEDFVQLHHHSQENTITPPVQHRVIPLKPPQPSVSPRSTNNSTSTRISIIRGADSDAHIHQSQSLITTDIKNSLKKPLSPITQPEKKLLVKEPPSVIDKKPKAIGKIKHLLTTQPTFLKPPSNTPHTQILPIDSLSTQFLKGNSQSENLSPVPPNKLPVKLAAKENTESEPILTTEKTRLKVSGQLSITGDIVDKKITVAVKPVTQPSPLYLSTSTQASQKFPTHFMAINLFGRENYLAIDRHNSKPIQLSPILPKQFISKATTTTITTITTTSNHGLLSIEGDNAKKTGLTPNTNIKTTLGIHEKNALSDKSAQKTTTTKTIAHSETQAATNTTIKNPRLAIIIDDIGNNRILDTRAANLPGAVTLAILPHRPHSESTARLGYKNNKEIMLHAPMESIGQFELGVGGLTKALNKKEFFETLQNSIDSVPHVSGLNNHMGSALTQEPEAMLWVMQSAQANDLFFVDSRTTHHSVAGDLAEEHQVRYVSRDIFLDNETEYDYIDKAFNRAIKISKQTGFALAIGHPYPATLSYLENKLPELQEQGIAVISVQDLINSNN